MESPTEHVGALYIENRRLLGEYEKLLDLLQSVVDGITPREHVKIDKAAMSWSIVLGADSTIATGGETR
jgi:hypothetical protein